MKKPKAQRSGGPRTHNKNMQMHICVCMYVLKEGREGYLTRKKESPKCYFFFFLGGMPEVIFLFLLFSISKYFFIENISCS